MGGMSDILLAILSWAVIIGVPVIVYRAMKGNVYRLLIAFIAGVMMFVLSDLLGLWLATHGQ